MKKNFTAGEGKTIDDMFFTDQIECNVARVLALEVTTSKITNCEECGFLHRLKDLHL